MQQDVTIINNYAPNGRPLKYMKQKLTEQKGEIDSSAIIVGDINPALK